MSTISQQLQDRRPAPFTPLAATNRYDHARFHIRVYSITCSTQRKLQEYCYDSDGTGKWAVGMSQSLDMSPCTPLAVISWYANDAPHIRVYYLSACNELQEYCFDGRWSPGALNNMHVQAAPNSSIGAFQYRRNNQTHIHLYHQECSNQIKEYYFDGSSGWLEGATLTASAVSGTSIGAVSYEDRDLVLHFRVYYQATDLSIREYCLDGGNTWLPGQFNGDTAPEQTQTGALVETGQY